MSLKQRPKTGTASTILAVVAVIALAGADHRVHAQADAETPTSAAGKLERKPQADHDSKSKRPTPKPTGISAVPEPTVELKAGEVPIIKFDSPVFDFGRIRAGTPVKHDFVFTNAGNGTLEILKAKAG